MLDSNIELSLDIDDNDNMQKIRVSESPLELQMDKINCKVGELRKAKVK